MRERSCSAFGHSSVVRIGFLRAVLHTARSGPNIEQEKCLVRPLHLPVLHHEVCPNTAVRGIGNCPRHKIRCKITRSQLFSVRDKVAGELRRSRFCVIGAIAQICPATQCVKRERIAGGGSAGGREGRGRQPELGAESPSTGESEYEGRRSDPDSCEGGSAPVASGWRPITALGCDSLEQGDLSVQCRVH